MNPAQLPEKGLLKETLAEAWDTHSEYQRNFLEGERDEVWAGWYAGFILGRLGLFTTPTILTRLLEATEHEADWAEAAAVYILNALNQKS